MTTEPKKIRLMPYAPFQIADFYEVDRRTLNKWLKPFKEEIGPRQGRFYTVAQVKKIFEKLCVPGIVIDE
jgi:hypothetical protein